MAGYIPRALILAAALLTLLSDCDGNSTPIQIGFIGPLSGHSIDLGLSGLNGVRLAVEEQNRQGGIDGHPILLVVEDDKQDPATATAAFERLAARNVDAVIGPMTSAVGVVLQPLADQHHLLLVSPTVTTHDLTGRDDAFIRVIADTSHYAEASAKFHREQRNIKSVAILFDSGNQAYADSWSSDFRDSFEKIGGKVVARVPYRSNAAADFAGRAQMALASGGEAILILGNAVDTALMCEQIRLINDRIPLITSEWAATESFIALGGQAVEGVYVAQFVDHESQQPRYLAFRRLFLDRFQREPGFAGITGFDAATMLITALKRRKSRETTKEAILRIADFDGLQSTIHIDKFGDSWRPTYISVIRNGKFIRVS